MYILKEKCLALFPQGEEERKVKAEGLSFIPV